MKKNVLPSKLDLEPHVPGAESAAEEVHRRRQEVIKRCSCLKGIGMIGAALSAVSLLSTGATAQAGSRTRNEMIFDCDASIASRCSSCISPVPLPKKRKPQNRRLSPAEA